MRALRSLLSWLLAAVACALAVVALAATWMDRQVMQTANWTDTSVLVLRDPEVQELTAGFLADQLVAQQQTVDRVRDALPPALRPFSGTATAALGQVAERTALEALRERALEDLWATASRDTHEQFERWIETAGEPTGDEDPVTLDLQPAIVRLAQRVGIPESIITESSRASGGARVPLVPAGRFEETRRDLHRLEQAAGLTLPLAIVVAVLSVLVAPRRRWAIVRIGLAAGIAGLVVAFAATELRAYLIDGLVDGGAARPVARTILELTTPDLVRTGWVTAVVGAVVALLAFVTRPGRPKPPREPARRPARAA